LSVINFHSPLEELEEQSKEVKDLLKTSKAKTSVKFEALKLLREECKDIQDKIDKIREEHDKKKEETTPAIDKMKEEYSSKIDTLKQKKKDMYNNHNEAWRKYEDQQAEIEKIKLIKRKKDKLIRDDIRRKREEEWRKQREQEAAENKEIPYLTQIELCELLIKYCNKLNPSASEASTAVSQKDKNTVIEEALQSNDWKEAKGQYILSRKEKEDDFFAGKGKKKVQKKPTTKPQEETGPQPLNHQIETLNYFDEIKVAPPLFTDKLPETLKVLQEKKAYFEKLSQEAMQADEDRKNLPEEERKRLAEEDKQKRNAEQQPEKKERKAKQAKFDVESEQDFPKM
jgi:predicted phage tail protein